MPPATNRRPSPDSFAGRPPFSWMGGDVSANFVNTVSWGTRSAERLRGYRDLVDWAAEAHLLAHPAPLRRAVARDAAAAAAALADALELRERLHELFTARASGRRPPRPALAVLDRWAAAAAAHRRLVADGDTLRWRWTDDGELVAPLRRVARAAALLLTSEDAALLKLCGNPTCGWVFVDRSRRGNRRWCEMAACGSREKARRYYRRTKEAARAPD